MLPGVLVSMVISFLRRVYTFQLSSMCLQLSRFQAVTVIRVCNIDSGMLAVLSSLLLGQRFDN